MNDKVKIFEKRQIRSVWDDEKEEWHFSVVDVVGALTEQPDYTVARKYWNKLKQRLAEEGAELVTNCQQLSSKCRQLKKNRLQFVAGSFGLGLVVGFEGFALFDVDDDGDDDAEDDDEY